MPDVVSPGLPRVATGVPGLDHLTGGGLPRGEVTLLAGAAGAGKTVTASQFLAAGITEHAEPGVYVSLSEGPEKVRRFTATLGWDVATWEAQDRWAFVDASPGVEQEVAVGDDFDLTPLLVRVAAAVSRIGAKRVVLDSISHLLGRLGGTARIRSQMYQLIAGLEALDATTIVTTERDADYDGVTRFGVEEFAADNILILRNSLLAERRRRTIEVLKIRGAAHHSGEVPFSIEPERGAVIVPLSRLPLTHPSTTTRISLGNPDIDALCGGGPFKDSVILVTGPTGTGKSLLSLEYLDAAGPGERSLLLAYEESPSQMARNARGWGHDLDEMQASGRLSVLSQYPESAPLAHHLVAIEHAIDDFQPTRVAVDSLSGIARNASARDFQEFLLGLTWLLKSRGITGLYTTTTTSLVAEVSASGIEASTLLDMIILLRHIEVYGEVRRGIAVVKMRGSDHDKAIREFVIDATGSRLGEPFHTTTGILRGAPLELLGDERKRVASLFGEDPADGTHPG
jgi:circadian clock protein KaiC